MVRTRADNCPASRKVVAARAPRKSLGSSAGSSGCSSSSGSSSPVNAGKKYAGGNPVCDRPTPDWQKSIGQFLIKKPISEGTPNTGDKENAEPGSSQRYSGSQSSDMDDHSEPRDSVAMEVTDEKESGSEKD